MLSRVLRRCSAQQPTAGFVAVASPSLSTSSTSFSRCSSSLPRSTPLFSSPFVRFFATSDSPVLGQKDQFLTQEEFQAKLAERRRHLPVEGEGFKSKEEWQAAMVAKEKARARRSDFRTFDQFLQALSAERELDYEEAEILIKYDAKKEAERMRSEFQKELVDPETGAKLPSISPNETEFQRDKKAFKKEMTDMRIKMQMDYQEQVKYENRILLEKWDEVQAKKAARALERATWKAEKAKRHQEWLDQDQKNVLQVREEGQRISAQKESQLETQRLYQVQQLVNEMKHWLLKDEDITEALFEEDHSDEVVGFNVKLEARAQRSRWKYNINVKQNTFDLKPQSNINFEQATEEWMTDSDEDNEFFEKMPKQ